MLAGTHGIILMAFLCWLSNNLFYKSIKQQRTTAATTTQNNLSKTYSFYWPTGSKLNQQHQQNRMQKQQQQQQHQDSQQPVEMPINKHLACWRGNLTKK